MRRNIMSKYFGTDGFRGEANKTLTVEHAYKIGRFLGWYYSRNKKTGNAGLSLEKTPGVLHTCLNIP